MAVPTQLAYRTLKGIGVLNAAPVYEPLPGFQRPEGNLRCCCYSPDGRFFAWALPEQVSVIDASVGHIITTLPAHNVYELGFSPLGTYIITWQRPSKDEDGNATKNLKVWRTIDDNAGAEGERNMVGQFVQRSQTGWNLQYTADERYCARVVTNEVQFYESSDLRTVWNKLRLEGVTDFAVSPGQNHSVAVFVPERKGQPAAVKVFNVPHFNAPVSQKTFFKGDKVQLKWNDQGSSIIVLAQTEVDKSNKSYYGETNMYILSAGGGFDARITLDKEGPIHDVSWSPNSKEFGVTYGYMPAKTVIFNAKAEPRHTFPLGPRNTILFSPHGRFVIVAGFGNLAGQMDIYDLSKDYAKVCTIEASNSSVCEWSPDGTHILTATTSPRLRVDNAIRMYHVGGGLMYNEEVPAPNELYHVSWRPQSTVVHPLLADPLATVPAPHDSAAAYLAGRKPSTKPAGAYRPPGARGTTTPLHFKREDEGGAAYSSNGIASTSGVSANGFGRGRRNFVPGAEGVEVPLPPGAAPGGGVSLAGTGEGADENLSKAALKNKKKREAKKARDGEVKEKGLNVTQDGYDNVPRGPRGPSRSPERRGHHQRTRSGYETFHQQHPHQQSHQYPHQQSHQYPHQQAHQHPHQHQGGKSPQRRDRSRNRERGPPGFQNGSRSQHNGFQQPPAHQQPPAQQQLQQPPTHIDIAPAASSAMPDLTVTSPGGNDTPQAKKERSLRKKLRAIQELKMRQAGGDKLEDTQIKKIATEGQVLRELADLGITDY